VSTHVSFARIPAAIISFANSRVGCPQSGNIGSSPVSLSCLSRYARTSSRKRSPNAIPSIPSPSAHSVRSACAGGDTGSARAERKPWTPWFFLWEKSSPGARPRKFDIYLRNWVRVCRTDKLRESCGPVDWGRCEPVTPRSDDTRSHWEDAWNESGSFETYRANRRQPHPWSWGSMTRMSAIENRGSRTSFR
jgi:hypothetical protein